ncbi:hypothetical protein O7630_33430 [Micromonospora sp. WMMD718]|uniref:hypothetical protein n=1 Tax=Micromonospora sp. WMMD718 TaxID=3016098 RepID=UPI002415BD71|nr:hypothetical protein [Micromonospora sp. WMMD718]MDG4755849.1 hypothetical protein [Micromonospora sp. WMMD718]
MEFAQQLVERAKTDGVSLVGPGGLLAGITRTVLESALGAGLDAHLNEAGVNEATGRRVNIRNGHGAKTCRPRSGRCGSRSCGIGRFVHAANRAEAGPPAGRVQRGDPVADAYGLTTGEISAHLADVYDADVSRELISRVADSVVE